MPTIIPILPSFLGLLFCNLNAVLSMTVFADEATASVPVWVMVVSVFGAGSVSGLATYFASRRRTDVVAKHHAEQEDRRRINMMLDGYVNMLKEKQDLLDFTKREISALHGQIDFAAVRFKDENEHVRKDMESLRTRYEHDLSGLRSDNANYRAENTQLREHVRTLEAEIAFLRKELEKQASLYNDNRDLRARILELETQITEIRPAVSAPGPVVPPAPPVAAEPTHVV